MGVAGRRERAGGGGLPTSLDFSANSGWKSVPSLPVSLGHARRLFLGRLAVSRYCGISLGRKLAE